MNVHEAAHFSLQKSIVFVLCCVVLPYLLSCCIVLYCVTLLSRNLSCIL